MSKRKQNYTEIVKKVKRTKKVSFIVEPVIVYIERRDKEVKIQRNIKDEAHNEYQRVHNVKFEEKTKSIDWFIPQVLKGSKIEKNSKEENCQRNREAKRIRFTNNNIMNKFLPEDMASKDEEMVGEGDVKEIAIVDLSVQNMWKKMDFVKIVENRDVDLKKILEDLATVIKFK